MMSNNKNMRKCKDCGNYISKKAKVCPYCGRDDRPIGQKVPAIGCFGVIILIIALWSYFSTMLDILHR